MSKLINYQTLDKNIKTLVVENDAAYLLSDDLLEIIVKDNVNLELVVFNQNTKTSNLLIRLEKNASLKIYNIIISSIDTSLIQNVYLDKINSSCQITSVLLANNNANLNSDINIYHPVEKTTSIFENYGIAKDNARITLNNNATIKKGAKKAVVKQKAKGLTLSKNASIKAMPNLFIDEYDVVANHSASIGSISKEDLFYLMSRGLTKEEATNLVIIGFIKPIVDNILDENLKDEIYKAFIKNLK